MVGNGICADDVVLAVKALARSVPATEIAHWLRSDTRSVATALRAPVKDGRVTITYRRGAKGEQRRGFYRFVRWTVK
jgi:hypothetical protein